MTNHCNIHSHSKKFKLQIQLNSSKKTKTKKPKPRFLVWVEEFYLKNKWNVQRVFFKNNKREVFGSSSQVIKGLIILIQFLRLCPILNYYFTPVMKKCQPLTRPLKEADTWKHTTIHIKHTATWNYRNSAKKRIVWNNNSSEMGDPAFCSISWQMAWRGEGTLLSLLHTWRSPSFHSSPGGSILMCWVRPRKNLDLMSVSHADFRRQPSHRPRTRCYFLFLKCFFLKVLSAHCPNPRAQPASLLTDLLSHGIHVVLSLVLSPAQMPIHMELSTASPSAWTYSQKSPEFLMKSSNQKGPKKETGSNGKDHSPLYPESGTVTCIV